MPGGSILKKDDRIYVAGHRGMVGSAFVRRLRDEGFRNIVTRTHAELDLTEQVAVREFFKSQSIDYVVLAAAIVGGIHANDSYPAEFIYKNLLIEANVIHEAFKAGIKHLLFLGSSCIYPKYARQPMKEEYLLSDKLEPTNEPYAIAKIAGIKLCEAYNRQYGTNFRAAMPTNLYGPNDNYDLENSHVLPALVRKFHLAKLALSGDGGGIEKDESIYGRIPDDIRASLKYTFKSTGAPGAKPKVVLWGTGSPKREFLYVDDMVSACFLLMGLPGDHYHALCTENFAEFQPDTYGSDDESNDRQYGAASAVSFINIGSGVDLTIRKLAAMVKSIVGYDGDVIWDETKPDGMPQKLLDVSRLKYIGWKPKINLEVGIRQTYESYQTTV